MNGPKLDGYDFSENLLTVFSSPDRKPGRPPKIPDELLRHDRDELLFVLEENWALVGWELQQAATTSDIRTAFRRIQGISSRNLEFFRMEYRRETTFTQLQAARGRFLKVFRELRDARQSWEKCEASPRLAKSALTIAHNAQTWEVLRPILEENEFALARAHRRVNQLQFRLMGLQKVTWRREASFAQSELLDFIGSDRYSSVPLYFANAMAGLPAIHWRQSMDRCVGFRDGVPHGLSYRQFLHVNELFKRSAASPEEAVDRMKMYLYQAKGQDVIVLNALAENWYFLRSAIQTVFRGKLPAEEALPYRIFSEYQRRFGCQSQLDILLAGKEILTTPAYVKERHRIGNA